MGAACTTGMTGISKESNTPSKVLIMGKQDAGKTFLLYSWKYGVDSIVSIEPTSHFNVDTVSSTTNGQKFLVYDLGGNIGPRQRNFFEGTDGVIYMLGPSETDFLQKEEQDVVLKLIQERELDNCPFLFVIRKQTQHTESTQVLPEQIQCSLEGREWDLVDMRPHCQEDSDLVLRVLEKLLKKAHHTKPE